MNHPKADVNRMYVQRKEGGSGMINLECALRQQQLCQILIYCHQMIGC